MKKVKVEYMVLENFKQIEESVEKAELVLVGLGEEWQVSFEDMMKDAKFAEGFQQVQKNRSQQEADYLFPFFAAEYNERAMPKRLEQAYLNLNKLLKDKNYFIISTNIDSYLKRMGFSEARCVNPCGTFDFMQCGEACEDTLCQAKQKKMRINELMRQGINPDCDIVPIVCEKCKEELAYNTIFAEKYQEKGYLPQWERYMKWLQGTVNKRLTVLELGVGMQLPSVIRWPFEKTVMYNQKSQFFRIHKSFPMLTAEIAERGYSLQEDSVTLLSTCEASAVSL